MSMTINTSLQLLSQISQNKGFRIGDDGQLKTQSSAARFFSKIGDAFKGLTKAGRAEIIARNAAIENKMIDILRADEPAVPNLAEAPIDLSVAMKQAPISNANLVKVMVPMLVRQLISPNQRDAVTNVVQLVIQSSGAIDGSRDELVDLITAKVNQLKEKPISVSQFNEKIASIITAKSPLPPALQASVDAALEDVRATWGDATLQKMSESLNWGVSAAIKKSSDFIDGEHLSAFIKEKAVGIAQHTLAEQAMSVAFESINYKSEITTASLVDSFMEDFPTFAEDLKACANRAEVDQLIENHTEDFITFASFYKTKETIVAQAKTRAVNMLAENVGLTPEQAQSKISFKKLDSTFSVVSSDFHCGATAEQMQDTLNKTVDRFVQKVTMLFMSADTLEASDELRTYFKNEALKDSSIPRPTMFEDSVAVAKLICGEKTDAVQTLFANGKKPTVEALFDAFMGVATRMKEALLEHFTPEVFADFGGDGQGLARFYAAKCVFDQVPALRDALRADPDFLASFQDYIEDQMSSTEDLEQIHIYNDVSYIVMALESNELPNADLVAGIRNPDKLPPAYLSALEQVKIEVSISFPELSLKVEDFKRYERALAGAVSSARKTLSPEEFAFIVGKALVSALIRTGVENMTAELMRDRNITLSADDTQVVISTLLNRHSELTAVTSSADLTVQLESYKADIAAIATSYHALSTAWAEGVARVTPAVAAAIGKSEDYVRENLNTFGTFEGGSFTVKRASFNGIINNPNTALADMPSPETIHAEFKAIIDKFVDGKKAAFEAVDTLPVPESHKENLRQIVLKNPRIKRAEFLTRSLDIANAMQGAGTALLTGLKDRKVSDEEVFNLMRDVAKQQNDTLQSIYSREQLDDFGEDGLGSLVDLSTLHFIGMNSDFGNLNDVAVARLQRINELAEDQMIPISSAMRNNPNMTEKRKTELQSALSVFSTMQSIIKKIISPQV